MDYVPLQGIVNLRINRFKLSQCFHIFLAERFSITTMSLASLLMRLNSATGVGSMDL